MIFEQIPHLYLKKGKCARRIDVDAFAKSDGNEQLSANRPRSFYRNPAGGVIDEASDFLGLRKEDAQRLQGLSIEMEQGDVLCFSQLVPHRADQVRWSMDIRYEAAQTATESGKAQGFIAKSVKNPDSVATCEQWINQWANIPKGSY